MDYSYPKKSRPSREREMLSQIGISFFHPGRVRGYFGLHAFDVLSEEIQHDMSVSTLQTYDDAAGYDSGSGVLTDLVSTQKTRRDIESILAKELGVSPRDIQMRDEKRLNSIFAQRLFIPGTEVEKVTNISVPGLFVKNATPSDEPKRKHRPFGDRYTVLIRTDGQVDEDSFLTHIARIESRGFLNFYHFTRFDKRLIAHRIGAEILKGNYEQAVKMILVQDSKFEYKSTAEARRMAQNYYPDMDGIKTVFEKESAQLKLELRIIEYLIKNPGDYLGALTHVSKFTHTILRGFSAYLFNRYISDRAAAEKRMKREIPLFPAGKSDDSYFYALYLEELEIPENYMKNLKPFGEIFSFNHKIYRPSRINTKLENITIIPDGVIISFDLPRETHVKTLLNNFFVLMTHGRVPTWVNTEKFDIFQTLGRESVQTILQKIKEGA